MVHSDDTHFHRVEGAAAAERKGENLPKNLSENKSIVFVVLQLQHESPKSKI